MSDEEDYDSEKVLITTDHHGHGTTIVLSYNNFTLDCKDISDSKVQQSREVERMMLQCSSIREDMEEFKKDGDSANVIGMIKEIRNNSFKGKSKGSITIKDTKSDLKEENDTQENSDGAEKETSVEKVFLREDEKIISEKNGSFKKDKTRDVKKWKKELQDEKNGSRQKLRNTNMESSTVQDNRFPSKECYHGDWKLEEEETPVKELMCFPMENEHTFDSMQPDVSMGSLDLETDKMENALSKNDMDKDFDEMEKTDQVKPENCYTEHADDFLSESLLERQLHLDSLNEDEKIDPIGFNKASVDLDKDFDSSLSMDSDNIIQDCSGTLPSEVLEVEPELLSTYLDKNGKLQSFDPDSMSELIDVHVKEEVSAEAEEDLKLQKEAIFSGADVSAEDDERLNNGQVTVDFLQKSSKLMGKCRRDLKDITNFLLKYTEDAQRTAQVCLSKGDNPPDSLGELLSYTEELNETVELVTQLKDRVYSAEHSGQLMDKLDIGTLTDLQAKISLTDLQAEISQGFEVQIRERKKMKKKVKQLEMWCLEMFDSKTAISDITANGVTPFSKFQPRITAKEKLVWTKGQQIPREIVKTFSSKLLSGGQWTSQGVRYKGDNLKRQPSDSGSGCHGNGCPGNRDHQKSSKNENGNRKGDDKENARNFDDEKDTDELEHPPERNNNEMPAEEDPSDTTAPSANFKFRRKEEIYNTLASLKEDVPPDIMEEIGGCLVSCLNSKKIGGGDVISHCQICAFLFSLISHFGNCQSDYNICSMCQSTFCLVSMHLQLCMNRQLDETAPECPLPICLKIQNKFKKHPEKISQRGRELWPKLKKYLARFSQSTEDVGPDISAEEAEDCLSLTSINLTSLSSLQASSIGGLSSLRSTRPSRTSIAFQPNLESISENTVISRPTGSRSEPFARKTESGEIIYSRQGLRQTRPSRLSLSEDYRSPYPSQSRSAPLVKKTEEGTTVLNQDFESLPPTSRTDRKVSFGAVNAEVFTTKSLPSPEEQLEIITEAVQYVSLNSEKVYGGDRTSSLPINFIPPETADDQLYSVQMRPSGVPGIGEVVYGHKDRLRYVARYWKRIKEDFEKNKTLQKKREEGVVLTENKEKFSIFRTRYQKNFQWIRLTHLGTGMSGKCHLAQDYNTDFKFCIKKIHILKFDERELDIWSDLSHQNIVQLYGAIRHGHNIYIFEEFIDGGCLTETINLQMETGHRLSHWTALNYLQQILQVLVYLEKRSVIHEDIKADNILLRKGTCNVVVSDFGVARRLEHVLREPSPVGTPTSYSPEKAKGQGHGARSDVWAAVCILIHMLSGSPPWVKRYGGVKTLIFVIVNREPPLQDLPSNVSQDVYKLVEYGLQKDPNSRPSASKLLQHEAFKILSGIPETFVSVLESPINTKIQISNEDEVLIKEVKDQYLVPQSMLPLSQGASSQNTSILPPGSRHNVMPSSSDSSKVGYDMTNPSLGAEPKSIQEKPSLVRSFGVNEEIQTPTKTFTPRPPPTGLSHISSLVPGFQEDTTFFGVVGPPSPPKYVEIDPTVFYQQYVDDKNVPEGNIGKYKEHLQLYMPDPESESNSGDEDIEKTLSFVGYSNFPELEMLLDSTIQNDDTPGRTTIPDIVSKMHDEALMQNMNMSGEVTHRTSEQHVPTSKDSLEGEETEQQERHHGFNFIATDPNDMPNFGTLLSESQQSHDTNSNNSNEANLPTVLFSLEDTPTITNQESSCDENSQQDDIESSVSTKSSTGGHISGIQEGSSSDCVSSPRNASQELSSGEPPSVYKPSYVLPDLEALMASFIIDDNPSIPEDALFCSGDEATSLSPPPSTPDKVQGHVNAVSLMTNFTPIITDKTKGAITKTKMKHSPPVMIRKSPVESEDVSTFTINSPPQTSPKTSTPFISPPAEKQAKKHLHLNLSPNKCHTIRQTSEPQHRSIQYRSPKPCEVKPYFTPQRTVTSPPVWRPSTTPPKSGGTSSGGKSDSKLELLTRENENKIAELLEEMSRNSENSRSQLDEWDHMSDPEAEDISIANDDEDETSAALMKIQEEYISLEVKRADSKGALVRVRTGDRELFSIKLEGEHILKSWEEVIDHEISEKLNVEMINDFILVDHTGVSLDLSDSPRRGEQTIYVQEPDPDSPWSCQNTVIQRPTFF